MSGQWTRTLTMILFVGLIPSCSTNKSGRIINPSKTAEVQDIRVAEGTERTVIEIEGEEPMIYTTFRLADPDRLVIDLAGVGLSGFSDELVMSRGPVRSMRAVSGSGGNVSRLEFELSGTVETDVRTEGVNLVLDVTLSDTPQASFVFFPEGAGILPQDELGDESDLDGSVTAKVSPEDHELDTETSTVVAKLVPDVVPSVDPALEMASVGAALAATGDAPSSESSTELIEDSEIREIDASLESFDAPASSANDVQNTQTAMAVGSEPEVTQIEVTQIVEAPSLEAQDSSLKPEVLEPEILEPATKVSSVHFDQGAQLALVVSSNGSVTPRSFFLGAGENRRLVIDLPGIKRLAGERRISVEDERIKRVRMGQHADKLRLVVDLSAPINYAIEQSGGQLRIRFAGPDETIEKPELVAEALPSNEAETIPKNTDAIENSIAPVSDVAEVPVESGDGLIALGKPLDGATSETLASHSEALMTMMDSVALDEDEAPLAQDPMVLAQIEENDVVVEETAEMSSEGLTDPADPADFDAPMLDEPMTDMDHSDESEIMVMDPLPESDPQTLTVDDSEGLPLPLPTPMIELAAPTESLIEVGTVPSEAESISSELSPLLIDPEPLVGEPAPETADVPVEQTVSGEMRESLIDPPTEMEQVSTEIAREMTDAKQARGLDSQELAKTPESERLMEAGVVAEAPVTEHSVVKELLPKKEEQSAAKKKVILRRQRREQVRSRRESVALALAQAEAEASAADHEHMAQFKGRKISLDFQDAQVTNVIRLIADVSGLNFVMGDDVKGKVTIKMHDVPWDQALDIILEIRSLGMVRQGDIIRVATLTNLNRQRTQKADARASRIEAEELFTRVVYVNYAKADQMKKLVTKLLSPRGEITVATRVNAIVIKDIEGTLDDIETMVKKLDTKTPQVLIEARIVEVQPNFKRSLGVQWGADFKTTSGGNQFGIGNSVLGGSTSPIFGQRPDFSVNLPASSNLGGVGFSFGRFSESPFQLDLRISAGESREMTRLVSTPKIMVLDNREAVIKQGRRIPFASQSANGGTNVQLIDASLQLKVTPHISGDGGILLDIDLTKNEPGPPIAGSPNPTIFDKEVTTNVLLMDGETMVIGGIFETKKSESVSGIPWLKDLPGIGWLFKNEEKTASTTELLIFITPTVMN